MPPPPPPPPAIVAPPPKTQARSNLLSSIEGFKKGKLKTTATNDRSTPVVQKNAPTPGGNSAGENNSNSSTTRNGGQQDAFSALGGLFAGGMPKLRKTGTLPTETNSNSKYYKTQ